MIKIILLLFPLVAFSLSITINAQEDNNISNKEVSFFQASLLKQRYQINKESARKILQENRFLSDIYLKSGAVDENILINFQLELERNLAKKIIEENEEKISISDEILKSYYLANQKEFENPNRVDLSIYKFKTFKSALEFFNNFNKNIKNINIYAEENSLDITIKKDISLNSLEKQLRFMIEFSKNTPPYLLEPQFYYDHFSVVHVIKLNPSDIKKFDNVKNIISKKLHKERLHDMKTKLLKPYYQ